MKLLPKNYFTYFLLLVISISFFHTEKINAQNSKIDSLKILLEQPSNDSLWFEITQKLAREYNSIINISKGKTLANKILKKAQKLKNYKNESWANALLCDYYYRRQEYDSSLFYAIRANEIAFEIQNQKLLAYTFCDMGMIYLDINEYGKSIKQLQQALDIYELHKEGDIIRIYATLASFHTVSGNYKAALKYYKLAIKYSKRANDTFQLSTIFSNIGAVYFFNEEYEKAIEFYQKGQEIFIEENDQEGMAISQINIGEAYNYLNEFEKAVNYLIKGLTLSRTINNKHIANSALYMLYEVYERKGNHQKSLEYYKSYIALKDSIFNEDKLRQIADMEFLYETEKKENQILTLEKDKQLSELELDKEKNQKLIFTIAAALFLVVAIASFLFFFQMRKQKKTIEARNELITGMNKKLSQSQDALIESNKTKDKFFALIAHDLRGPITSFQGIGRMLQFSMKKGKIEQAESLMNSIDQSANGVNILLDNLLKWSLAQTGTLPFHPSSLNLKPLVEDVVTIYLQSCIAKNINLENLITENILVTADNNTISTVLRNLIGNAYKFTNEGGEITIDSHQGDEYYEISVTDTGVGIPKEKLTTLFDLNDKKSTTGTKGEKGTGLGLMLCKEFVVKNSGEIWVESEEGSGTRITFSLPLIKDDILLKDVVLSSKA